MTADSILCPSTGRGRHRTAVRLAPVDYRDTQGITAAAPRARAFAAGDDWNVLAAQHLELYATRRCGRRKTHRCGEAVDGMTAGPQHRHLAGEALTPA